VLGFFSRFGHARKIGRDALIHALDHSRCKVSDQHASLFEFLDCGIVESEFGADLGVVLFCKRRSVMTRRLPSRLVSLCEQLL
jgi:hypothetical protein